MLWHDNAVFYYIVILFIRILYFTSTDKNH